MGRKKIFIYCLLGLFLQACQSESAKKDIRNFYFPLKTLQDGMVYEYAPQGNTPSGPAYWYYRSIIQDREVHLTSTFYEQDLIPSQLSNELMTETGMVLEDLFLYERDSTSDKQEQIPVQVVQDDVFPFQVRANGGIFLYHVSWESPSDPGAIYEVIKNRRYLRDTTFILDEQKYDAVLFELKELISYDKDGVLEQQYEGQEIYAKGIGLVYYTKKISEALELSYRLKSRYPMEQLEEKFRLQYQEANDKETLQ